MLQRIWSLCCSLKLTIILASLTTIFAMFGSLLIVRHPQLFNGMDDSPLLTWFQATGIHGLQLSWWLPLTTLLILLLALNTLCCFIDWARHFSARWRKCGEYLIHLGFILIVVAYGWGSIAGFRSDGNAIASGDIIAIKQLPGYFLRLNNFQPRMAASGRPIDMLSNVSLLKGDQELTTATVRFNHPLTYGALSILPGSFEQRSEGFLCQFNNQQVELKTGITLAVNATNTLRVQAFYPNVVHRGDRIIPSGNRLINPAFLLQLTNPQGKTTSHWYVVKQRPPRALSEAGVSLIPIQPLYQTYSVLTINRDPGAPLALAGGVAMMLGVSLALFSFYYKRKRKDRPEIT